MSDLLRLILLLLVPLVVSMLIAKSDRKPPSPHRPGNGSDRRRRPLTQAKLSH